VVIKEKKMVLKSDLCVSPATGKGKFISFVIGNLASFSPSSSSPPPPPPPNVSL
jgi:hypothetical protein